MLGHGPWVQRALWDIHSHLYFFLSLSQHPHLDGGSFISPILYKRKSGCRGIESCPHSSDNQLESARTPAQALSQTVDVTQVIVLAHL